MAHAQGVGGTDDHVHLLVALKATHCLSDFMRELKKASSTWVHHEIDQKEFEWQEGYGAFTVSPAALDKVKSYIAKQVEHHRMVDFADEFKSMLRLAGVEYDQRYFE